jgi:predicted metal-dependent hydrolase
MVSRKKSLELAPEVEVDPTKQDRRHSRKSVTLRTMDEKALAEGFALAREGRYFEAHEAFEGAWRTAPPDERDFCQGLVHVVVAWYQASRANRVGCERQLEKARRRLAPYAPSHRGVDVAAVLAQIDRAEPLELAPLQLPEAEPVEQSAHADVQPPLAVEEQEQTEENKDRAADDTHD